MPPEDIVAGQLAAYNRRDLEQFLSYYADPVRLCSFPSGEELADLSGPAFRPRYQALFESSPNLRATVSSRITLGDIVIDEELVTGFMGDRTIQAVAIYQVGPDKIERVWFVDRGLAARDQRREEQQ
ncbi:nuclear transport factor 2 family protein [Actinocrispum wychmicini]|uniref:SnoaL-like domain-containing protein n=1 Tax=Actinocrispum wychmicini TaxID=1213861 RepID=A0A4V2S5Z0_9PSEU|nr:nuclear transport factor 2 family protein [Actinocrispum wychmicini]TCO54040.1 hypothetical protein EV192_10920 [Actinocrispum wychmicini]